MKKALRNKKDSIHLLINTLLSIKNIKDTSRVYLGKNTFKIQKLQVNKEIYESSFSVPIDLQLPNTP
jgi:hypothetical protein